MAPSTTATSASLFLICAIAEPEMPRTAAMMEQARNVIRTAFHRFVDGRSLDLVFMLASVASPVSGYTYPWPSCVLLYVAEVTDANIVPVKTLPLTVSCAKVKLPT